jgi:uncharacterized protein
MAHDTYQGNGATGADEHVMKEQVYPPHQLAAREALAERVEDVARITLRPIASPMPVGFIGLAGATFLVAALNLGWIATTEGHNVALALIAFVFPLQLGTSIFAMLARDGVGGTAMAVLAGMWLTTGLVMFTSPPGSTSDALGVLFLVAAVAMLWPAIGAAMGKVAIALVLFGAALRFATSGAYQLTGDHAWELTTGWIGVALGVLALYAALAALLEGVAKRTVLPMGRRGRGREAVEGGLTEQIVDLTHEPGVRSQL